MKLPPDIFKNYGTPVTLNSRQSFSAFFQPLRKKQQDYFVPRRHLSGVFTNDKHLIIAPPEIQIETGDCLTVQNKEYAVVSAGNRVFQNQVLYVWAVVTARTEQEADDFYD